MLQVWARCFRFGLCASRFGLGASRFGLGASGLDYVLQGLG